MQSVCHKFAVAMLFLMSTTSLSLGPGARPAVAQAQPGSTSEYGALKDDVERIKRSEERRVGKECRL